MANAGFILSAVLYNKLGDTIIPFTRTGVNISVKLTGADALRVENMRFCRVVRTSSIIFKRRDSVLQHTVIHRFTTTSRSDKHESVTHLNGIIELNDLILEDRSADEFEMLERFLDCIL